MKRFLPIALGLLLCHCGTEVGNGIAPEPKATGTGANNDGASAPEASDSPNSYGYSFSNVFLVACASPFSEPMEGTFKNASVNTADAGFAVTTDASGKKTVKRLDGSILHVITPSPAGGPYAIEIMTASPSATCSAVSTQILSDGRVERSVTLDNGIVVQWALDAGKVISMKMTTPTMITESWTKN